MQTTRQTTMMDVRSLTQEPSAQIRGVLAGKIAADYRTHQFSTKESQIAEDIFRILLRDADSQIRVAMSQELAHSEHTPHDVILALANDVDDSVSIPILQFSQVLSEDELIQLVRATRSIERQHAVASRESVSQDLCAALMEGGHSVVLHQLFMNQGALLNEANMLPAWKSIAFTPSLLEALVERGSLPLTVVEKLYHACSEQLRQRLSHQYRLHAPALAKAAHDAREWQLLGVAPQMEGSSADDYELAQDLIDDLAMSGRLTHSLIMRALCVGNIGVFECGMARLAEVPRVNARILMLEASGKGLKALYEAASMPEGFYEAVRLLLTLSLEETEFGRKKPLDFRQRIIERITRGHYHRSVENMGYLLSIIGGKISAEQPVH